MTRLVLITLLLLSSAPAYAEWVPISGEDQDGMTTYADQDTIRRKGDVVKMWHLFDFKTKQSKSTGPYLSVKAQEEYDCAEELHRNLAFTFFSGNMGTGKVGSSNSSELKWEPVAPESVTKVLGKFACDKK